nr:hypothetical protein [Tanacetum cinerariifolium]
MRNRCFRATPRSFIEGEVRNYSCGLSYKKDKSQTAGQDDRERSKEVCVRQYSLLVKVHIFLITLSFFDHHRRCVGMPISARMTALLPNVKLYGVFPLLVLNDV